MTIAWTAVAGVAGLAIGAIVRSVSMTAFGLDAIVELACAIVVLKRLGAEIVEGLAGSEIHERRAAAIVGVLLLAAALYIAIDAALHLLRHQVPQVSGVGLILTIASIFVLVPLAQAKLKVARQIGSRALRADAIGNVVCWYLAAVVLASIVAQAYLRAWWLDGGASLVIVALLVVEGAQALRGAEIAA